MSDRIIAACDGASKGNPGPAAWAWVIADAAGEPGRWEAGPLGAATNNVAELTALRNLLEAADPHVPMEVRMDSQYAMKAVTVWLPGWRAKGWRTAAGKPVANRDLVVRIEELLADRSVRFVHTPAHRVDGDRLNAFADRAASGAAVTQQAAGTSYGSPPPTAPAGGGPTRASRGAPGPGRRRSATGPGGRVRAKFPGRCHCGRRYAAGEPIVRTPHGWGHPGCGTAASGRSG